MTTDDANIVREGVVALIRRDRRYTEDGLNSPKPMTESLAGARRRISEMPRSPIPAAVYLAIKRSQTVIAPGRICFPGGGIEPGETPEEALVRECREELGLEIVPGVLLDVSVTPWKVRLRWYAATIAPNVLPRPNPEEVESVRWMTLREMLDHPDVLESNVPFLERMIDQENCS